jgi:hypothetical protein
MLRPDFGGSRSIAARWRRAKQTTSSSPTSRVGHVFASPAWTFRQRASQQQIAHAWKDFASRFAYLHHRRPDGMYPIKSSH